MRWICAQRCWTFVSFGKCAADGRSCFSCGNSCRFILKAAVEFYDISKVQTLTKSLPYAMEHKTCNFCTGHLMSMPMFHYTVHILSDLFGCLLPSLCCSFLVHALKMVAEDCIKSFVPWTRVYGVTLQMFICVVVKRHFLPDRTNCTSVRGAYCQWGGCEYRTCEVGN